MFFEVVIIHTMKILHFMITQCPIFCVFCRKKSQISKDLTEPHGPIKTSEDTKCEPC